MGMTSDRSTAVLVFLTPFVFLETIDDLRAHIQLAAEPQL